MRRKSCSGSFLIQALLSVVIVSGSVLGILKLISISDALEYDSIQRLSASTEIYNYFSTVSVLLSGKLFQTQSDIMAVLDSLGNLSVNRLPTLCAGGSTRLNFIGSATTTDGYRKQRDFWISNLLRNVSLPLINPAVIIRINSIINSEYRPTLMMQICYRSMRYSVTSLYQFFGALPLQQFPGVRVSEFNYENVVSCSLDSMPEVNCRFYYETPQPDPYTVDYTLPYRVNPASWG